MTVLRNDVPPLYAFAEYRQDLRSHGNSRFAGAKKNDLVELPEVVRGGRIAVRGDHQQILHPELQLKATRSHQEQYGSRGGGTCSVDRPTRLKCGPTLRALLTISRGSTEAINPAMIRSLSAFSVHGTEHGIASAFRFAMELPTRIRFHSR